jgi:pimeloyl-ACP methyl ester carboxylesterase
MGRRHGARALVVALTFLTAAATPTVGAARPAFSTRCTDIRVSVALAEGKAASHQVFGRLCTPVGRLARAVQLLVHGITYDHGYWDFPDPTGGTDRYSYVAAAHRAGYATFAIDRIGSGRSSRPPGLSVTIDVNASVVHQVVTALRAGFATLDGATPPFEKVVLVGHSYGSWTSWVEASKYHDVDAVVLTGVSHRMPLVGALPKALNLYPAVLDPKFGLFGPVDASYLTTRAGTRYEMFYAPAPADPAVVTHDEATKQTITVGEFAAFPSILVTPLDIRVPVLLVNGPDDQLFCNPSFGGTDCSSAAALVAAESPHLGAQVPRVDAYVLPGAGHDLTPMYNAREFFAATQAWVTRVVPAG